MYEYKQVKNDVKIYALSQGSASSSVNVHLLSQRCAIQSELQERAPQRNLWGSFNFNLLINDLTRPSSPADLDGGFA